MTETPDFKETISLCMVVKDEAETLRQAVESMKGIVDEVIIGVDKTCTDDTPAIAKDLADIYFEFDFDNDFAGTRNQAIERASGSLIFILDGHEWLATDDDPILEHVSKMHGHDPEKNSILTARSYLEQVKLRGLDAEFDVCCFTLTMNVGDDRIPQIFFLQPRMFRNNKGIKYESRVHNHLVGYENEKAVGCPEVILIHNMPDEREKKRMKQRAKMNVSGLFKDHKEKPDDPRPMFYLGNTYADNDNKQKAIYWYERYLSKSGFNEERYQALQQLAVLYWRTKKDKKKALAAANEAVQLNPRRREPWILMTEIATDEGNYDLALQWLNVAEQIHAPPTVMFLQGSVYTYMPDSLRINIGMKTKNWALAATSAQKVLNWRPNDVEVHKALWAAKENMKEDARKEGKRNLLIVDRIGSFTGDIARELGEHFKVNVTKHVTETDIQWADFVWIEWCDDNAIEMAARKVDCPVMVRLHSYEAFTDMPARVNWKNIDCLVFVADHIREHVVSQYPQIAKDVKMTVIPNGIDPASVPFTERAKNNKIAYVGYLNEKKNIPLLIECAKAYPEYEFHVAGQFQSPHLAYWFQGQVEGMSNIWWHGWLDGDDARNAFFEDKSFIISPSIVESFGYSIVEGMLMGLKPLIAKRQGVFWEESFDGVLDLRRLLDGPYEPMKYRRFVEDNYTLGKQMSMTLSVIGFLLGEEKDPEELIEYKTLMQNELRLA